MCVCVFVCAMLHKGEGHVYHGVVLTSGDVMLLRNRDKIIINKLIRESDLSQKIGLYACFSYTCSSLRMTLAASGVFGVYLQTGLKRSLRHSEGHHNFHMKPILFQDVAVISLAISKFRDNHSNTS